MTRETFARLYNLESGSVIHAKLYDFNYGHGKMEGVMPDGEKLTGEYVINSGERKSSGRPLPIPLYQNNGIKDTLSVEETLKKTLNGPPWLQEYGFNFSNLPVPVGTAVLIGDRGTVVEVVIYNFNFSYDYGDGIARDNKGGHYRIYVGEIEQNTKIE